MTSTPTVDYVQMAWLNLMKLYGEVEHWQSTDPFSFGALTLAVALTVLEDVFLATRATKEEKYNSEKYLKLPHMFPSESKWREVLHKGTQYSVRVH